MLLPALFYSLPSSAPSPLHPYPSIIPNSILLLPCLFAFSQLVEVPYGGANGYRLSPVDDPTYFPGRCADILVGEVSVGRVGVLHPDVIVAFDLSLPCAAVEINIEHCL